ncbi:hypothetical protein Thiowin_01181 [Thiorhodovibrio winogradskyi]|uniref:Uncharacterized protein n=1 Tax=Thiorhodovibrio winogradskyi TaxID=77007 RepID=A0ABZ0S7J2_9GAMM|nr:hypothetical protein [Thiorhodovibrio winogradskyi]
MKAIEFSALPTRRLIEVPAGVPDGVQLRVLLLWEPPASVETDLKTLFASATEGLTDQDLERSVDTGRIEPSWDI